MRIKKKYFSEHAYSHKALREKWDGLLKVKKTTSRVSPQILDEIRDLERVIQGAENGQPQTVNSEAFALLTDIFQDLATRHHPPTSAPTPVG